MLPFKAPMWDRLLIYQHQPQESIQMNKSNKLLEDFPSNKKLLKMRGMQRTQNQHRNHMCFTEKGRNKLHSIRQETNCSEVGVCCRCSPAATRGRTGLIRFLWAGVLFVRIFSREWSADTLLQTSAEVKSVLKSTSHSVSFLPALFLTHHFLLSKWMAVSKLKGSRSCENNRPRKRIFNFASISLMMKPVLNIKQVLRVEHQE